MRPTIPNRRPSHRPFFLDGSLYLWGCKLAESNAPAAQCCGRCVRHDVAAVCVIHQPRPAVFASFDRLVLLAHGTAVFSARCSQLPTLYTDVFKQPVPLNHELADDLLRQAAVCKGAALGTSAPREMPRA